MLDRKAYFKKYQADWYKRVMCRRRQEWFTANGPCVDCGSWERLELDHENPAEKTHHAVWSWTEVRRIAELAKCKPRCHTCHAKKSRREQVEQDVHSARRKKVIDGKTWCAYGEHFALVEEFTRDKLAGNGCYTYCRACRRLKRRKNAPVIQRTGYSATNREMGVQVFPGAPC